MSTTWRTRLKLAIATAFIGAAGFIFIYGVKILDVTNTDWIKNAGGDLTQSYFGWQFFRNSSWHFPIGLMDSVAYPNLISIIYIDSIPLFNIVFKLFDFFLPDNFQFFGIWGLFCFMVSGVLSSVLLLKLTDSWKYSFVGSVFFIFCNIAIQRLYTHTALAANWIIILSLYPIIFRDELNTIKKQIISWNIIFFLCVSVNIYYIPISGMFMIFFCFYLVMKQKKNHIVATIFSVSVSTVLVTMFLYGGFYKIGDGSANPAGLGYYCANLNSLVNPLETHQYLSGASALFGSLKLAYDGQYEGYAYLGAGVLTLLILGALGYIKENFYFLRHKIKKHIAEIHLITFCSIGLIFLALGPNITINDKIIYTIPYPEWIKKIYGIFRSTGRFMWGVWDIFVLIGMCAVFKGYRKKVSMIIITLCCFLQLFDFTELLVQRRVVYNREDKYESLLSGSEWDMILSDKKQIVFFNDQMSNLKIYYDFADYALQYGLSINDFYYSRRNADEIDRYKTIKMQEIVEGNADKECIYVFDTFEKAKNVIDKLNLYCIDNIIIGLSEKVDRNAMSEAIAEIVDIEVCSLQQEQRDSPEGYLYYKPEADMLGLYGITVDGSEIKNVYTYVKNFSNLDRRVFMLSQYDADNRANGIFKLEEDYDDVVIELSNTKDISSVKVYRLITEDYQ